MNLYESIKVNKIDKKKIIKNEAIPANNQYNVEAENDNEKKLDIVEKLANDFVEYLRKNEIFAELDDYSIAENQRTNDIYGVIDYSISWGDWKHDHLYSEDLAKEFFKEDLSISEDVTEEDGSDTYSATHEFSFHLAPYLGKEMKEGEGLSISMTTPDFEELVKRDFKLFLLDKYNDEEYKDVTEDDINEYFTGMFYDIVDNDDLDTSNAAEEIIRKEYGFEDKLEESDENKEYTVVKSYEELPFEDFRARNTLGTLKNGKNFIIFDDNDVYIINGDIKELKKIIYSEEDEDLKLFDKFMDENSKRADNELETQILVDTKRLSPEALDEAELSPEKIVLDSYNHIANELGKEVTIDFLFEDIINDYTQDYFKDDTPENAEQAYKDIVYYLKKNNLEYSEAEEYDDYWNLSEDVPIIPNFDLGNFPKDKLWNLRNEITLGSPYLSKYDNSLGLNPIDLRNFFNSFIENGKNNNKTVEEIDNPDDLYNFYISCDDPFNMEDEDELNESEDNKLNESSTEERWNATELDREGFYAVLKFNNPEEHLNPSLCYIITRDGNEVYRFAMSGTNEKIKDAGAKIEFRNFLKSKNNEEIEEAEEIIDINNLTKEQLWKLRKEIVLGSLYVDDYKNSFGIEPEAVRNFFDSFIEDSQVDDEGKPNNRKTEEYDNAEDLYNYYSSCEYPFGEIEITETEEIKEEDNDKFVKNTLNGVALNKISNAIVNIEDAVSLINDNDEAKNKIKSIVEELENYLGLDDYGRPKA